MSNWLLACGYSFVGVLSIIIAYNLSKGLIYLTEAYMKRLI